MGLYLALVRAQVSAQWQYRGSFVVQAVGQFLATFTDFVMLLLLFQQFPSIAGWTLGEVASCTGWAGWRSASRTCSAAGSTASAR